MINSVRTRFLRPAYGLLLKAVARLLNLFSPHRAAMQGIFHANPSPAVNRAKNLLRPQRMRLRRQYGQLPGMSTAGTLAKPIPHSIRPQLEDAALRRLSETLAKDGIVKLPIDFAAMVEACKQRYCLDPSLFAEKSGYFIYTVDPWADGDIMSMLCHPLLLRLLALRFGAQPILRHPPVFRIDRPQEGPFVEADIHSLEDLERANAGFAQNWHSDNADLMHIDILFEDVSELTSHMEFALGSHNIPFCALDPEYDANFADKVVRDSFDIVPLVGKAGTIYVWNGNGLHRMRPKKETFRSLLIFYSTPGNNLIASTEGWPPLPVQSGSAAPEPAGTNVIDDPLAAEYLAWPYPAALGRRHDKPGQASKAAG